ncbi:MAG: diacylglycerol kinase [Kordiimonadaceae bacterium]|nr:diacylglycerol kinase [Kordiimonadaceae bacterium]
MKNHSFLKRLDYAWQGIKASWLSEKSFRTQIIATVLIVVILTFSRPDAFWWAILLLTCGLVLALELVNTAVEKLIDHLHPEIHPVLKIVKDALAGAVLVASIISLCIFLAFIADIFNI